MKDTLGEGEVAFLEKPFTKREVKRAIFGMGAWKSPGPDGIPAAFYKKRWKLVKEALVPGVLSSLNSGFILKSINRSRIVLIPTRDNLETMDHFRPISLCNVTYKIISKCVANRIRKVISGIVSPQQNAFIPRRQIADSILLAHEILEIIRTHNGRCKTN